MIESQTESLGKQKQRRAGGPHLYPKEFNMSDHEAPLGKVLICRPFITVKGKRIFASAYGKEAFCFYVDAEKSEK